MATKRAVYEIAEFKAVGDPSSGKFKAVVSVFNNVDLQGDRVMPGAFKADLAQWQAKGDPIPVIWSHDWQNPFAHIGAADPKNVRETAKGLEVDGQNDMSDPFAAKVHQLLVDRRVTQWSFAYEVVQEETAKDGANNLLELKIIEVGPTLKGANGLTDTVAAKAAGELYEAVIADMPTPEGAKAGRRISKATEAELQGIHDQLGDAQSRMKALMGAATVDDSTASAEPEPKGVINVNVAKELVVTEIAEAVVAALKNAEAATSAPAPLEAEATEDDDREPQAKSVDDETLALRTRLEEMRATKDNE